MDYADGLKYMISLHKELRNSYSSSYFKVGNLLIEYPGKKNNGDYRLSINGIAPKHTDIVRALYKYVTDKNSTKIIIALEDLYSEGLNSKNNVFKQSTKELIYWITLQEEINYPQPKYLGRKLPFQRYYEGLMAKLKLCELSEVLDRTNNNQRIAPKLYENIAIQVPNYYF